MYTFDIVGVSPVLYFFNQQQEIIQNNLKVGVEYVSSVECTLDALIYSVETVAPNKNWSLDEVVSTVINFWMKNAETIHYWKYRLRDAGTDSILVSRIADLQSLRTEFDRLFEN